MVVDFSKMTVVELKGIAKDLGITGFSRLRKAELVTTIKKASRKGARKTSRKSSKN
jgi:hypothetical protein